MKETIIAGLLAGLVLGLFMTIFTLFRGRKLSALLVQQDAQLAKIGEKVLFYLVLLSTFLFSCLVGVLAGMVFNWVGSRISFTVLGLGMAGVLSALAMVSRTPLIPEKIVMNFLVGGTLGLLIPYFMK